MSKGRTPLSIGMKQNKKHFDEQLKAYSPTALNNIINIAESAFDVNTRLKANMYLLDRCYGRDFRAVTPEQEKQDNTLNVVLSVVKNSNKVNNEHISEQIYAIENSSNSDDLLADLGADDSWGDDVYDP